MPPMSPLYHLRSTQRPMALQNSVNQKANGKTAIDKSLKVFIFVAKIKQVP